MRSSFCSSFMNRDFATTTWLKIIFPLPATVLDSLQESGKNDKMPVYHPSRES
jgi:hypothetical protein